MTIELIIESVCKEYGVAPEELVRKKWFSRRYGLSGKCPQRVSIAKQVICYLAINHLKMTNSFIAKRLNYKDHTIIKKNYDLTVDVMTVDVEFRQRIAMIEENLLK